MNLSKKPSSVQLLCLLSERSCRKYAGHKLDELKLRVLNFRIKAVTVMNGLPYKTHTLNEVLTQSKGDDNHIFFFLFKIR